MANFLNVKNGLTVPELDYRSLALETTSRSIYIATTGSDTTGTGLVGAPFAKLERALRDIKPKIPFGVTITVLVNPGAYTLTDVKLVQSLIEAKTGGGAIVIKAVSGSEWQSSGVTGTMTANTYYTHTDSSKNWTTNAYQGMFVKSNAGSEYFAIESNTLDTLYCSGSLTFAPVTLGAYTIYQHSVIFQTSGSYETLLSVRTASMGISVQFDSVKLVNLGIYGTIESIDVALTKTSIMNTTLSESYATIYSKKYGSTYNFIQAAVVGVSDSSLTAVNLVNTTALIDHTVIVNGQFGNSIIGQSSKVSGIGAITPVIQLRDLSVGMVALYDMAFRNFDYAVKTKNYHAPKLFLSDALTFFNTSFFLFDVYNKTQIINDPGYPVYDLGTPGTAFLTINGTTEADYYVNFQTGLDCALIAPAAKNYTPIATAKNIDIDTGTEVVDSFAKVVGHRACRWDYVLDNGSGTNMRAGALVAVWNPAGTIKLSETTTSDIGDTEGATFSAAISGDNIELRLTVTSDNWSGYTNRYII